MWIKDCSGRPGTIHPLRGLRRRPKASRALPRTSPDNKEARTRDAAVEQARGYWRAPQGGLGETTAPWDLLRFIQDHVQRREVKVHGGHCMSWRFRSLVVSPGPLCLPPVTSWMSIFDQIGEQY